MNFIRRIKMGIISGNPKEEPMHYGEVYGTWSYLLATKAAIAGHQLQRNLAGDEDLQKLFNETIKIGLEEVKQIEILLKENGIGLPPTPPAPTACLDDIPIGARIQDPSVAAALSASVANFSLHRTYPSSPSLDA